MLNRVSTAALTVFCFCAALTPSSASAQPGHWRTEAEFLREAGPEWEKIAPGVYELRRGNGRVTRLGFGVESFRFALEERRAELAEMEYEASTAGDSGFQRRQQKTEETIAFLEESLRKAEVELTPEQARLANKDDYDSGSTCGGHFSLDVTFSCGLASGTTTSTATWGEFGPYAPYQKTLHTYAAAAVSSQYGAPSDADSDTYGPFSGACCVNIQAQATAPGPTWSPRLFGEAYVAVSTGCSDFRYVSDTGTC